MERADVLDARVIDKMRESSVKKPALELDHATPHARVAIYARRGGLTCVTKKMMQDVGRSARVVYA